MHRPIFLITSYNKSEAEKLFDKLYHALPSQEGQEPMMNIIARYEGGQWLMWVFPRSKHRPDCYYAQDDKRRLISPASVEMGGLFIAPQRNDYDNITTQEIVNIYNEVCPTTQEIEKIVKKLETK